MNKTLTRHSSIICYLAAIDQLPLEYQEAIVEESWQCANDPTVTSHRRNLIRGAMIAAGLIEMVSD